jgi:hypothetical protein
MTRVVLLEERARPEVSHALTPARPRAVAGSARFSRREREVRPVAQVREYNEQYPPAPSVRGRG